MGETSCKLTGSHGNPTILMVFTMKKLGFSMGYVSFQGVSGVNLDLRLKMPGTMEI